MKDSTFYKIIGGLSWLSLISILAIFLIAFYQSGSIPSGPYDFSFYEYVHRYSNGGNKIILFLLNSLYNIGILTIFLGFFIYPLLFFVFFYLIFSKKESLKSFSFKIALLGIILITITLYTAPFAWFLD